MGRVDWLGLIVPIDDQGDCLHRDIRPVEWPCLVACEELAYGFKSCVVGLW